VRKKAIWIGGGVVATVVAMVAIALRPVKDDFAALKPYIAQDATTYFSAAEIKKNWATLGSGTSMRPPDHDTSCRILLIRSVPGRKALELFEKVAKDRRLTISKERWETMGVVYTPSGKYDPETQLKLQAVEVGKPWFGTSIEPSMLSEQLVDVWIYDTKALSFWDEMRIRSKNNGRACPLPSLLENSLRKFVLGPSIGTWAITPPSSLRSLTSPAILAAQVIGCGLQERGLARARIALEASRLQFARSLVVGENDAGLQDLRVHQLKRGRDGAFGKKSLSATDGNRIDSEPHFIDQVVLQKRLDEHAAAPDVKYRAVFILQSLEFGHDIILNHDRFFPRSVDAFS
jgi:hypothetical protein